MERPMPAPRRYAPRGNQSLEGAVPARGRRAHAPPQPAAIRVLIIEGPPTAPPSILVIRSTPLTPATEHARTRRRRRQQHHPKAPPRRAHTWHGWRLVSDVVHHEAERVCSILVHRPCQRQQQQQQQQAAPAAALAHQSPDPARGAPRPSVHRSSRENGGRGRARARTARLGGFTTPATTTTVDAPPR